MRTQQGSIEATEMKTLAPPPASIKSVTELIRDAKNRKARLDDVIKEIKKFVQSIGEQEHIVDTFTKIIREAFDYGSEWNLHTRDEINVEASCFPYISANKDAEISASLIQEFYKIILLEEQYFGDIAYILAALREIGDDLRKEMGLAHAISKGFFYMVDSRYKLPGGFINFFTPAEKRYYYSPEFRSEKLDKTKSQRKIEILKLLKKIVFEFAAQQLPEDKLNNIFYNQIKMLATKQRAIMYTLMLCGEGQPVDTNLIDQKGNYNCCVYLDGLDIKFKAKLFDGSSSILTVTFPDVKQTQLRTMLHNLKNHTTEIDGEISIVIKKAINKVHVPILERTTRDLFSFIAASEGPAPQPPTNINSRSIIFS